MQGTQVHSLVEEVRSYMLCGVAEKEKIIKMKNIKNMSKQWSPTFLTPGTSFMEDNFSTGQGGEGGFGFAHRSPPAVQPGSKQAMDPYRFVAQELGAPEIENKK